MLVVPVNATPTQTLSVVLNGQNCSMRIFQTDNYGLYLDLYLDDALIVGGRLCLDRTWIVRAAYSDFVGDLMFIDQQGISDPTYDGLGDRFLLYYSEPSST
ncbi:phage baseplate plug family protein [Nguyenibacter vanlangensis]|uniref:Cyanophage baseplate Pam3 plug gp18 domain-containing protein n=1 Tax=Nguyenibacter vanlangensis TaxID=1216886 RepID=A0A7Y7ITW2_9PROT|nr:hypothetical protein [Nguyenibacter vanlangensis]NVN09706.1 hypothetical protein [Nguyenibacter vanlangensis]